MIQRVSAAVLLSGLGLGVAGAAGLDQVYIRQTSVRLPEITLYADLLDAASKSVDDPTRFQVRATVGDTPTQVTSIQSFAKSGEGSAYLFMVDVSVSLHEADFAGVREALRLWISDLKVNDRAAIYSFGEKVNLEADFTKDRARLLGVVEKLKPADSKTLLNVALARALDHASGRIAPDLPRRRAIIVLSDGQDDGSPITLDDVFRDRESSIPIYSIGYSRTPAHEKGFNVLKRISTLSGGLFSDASETPLPEVYKTVLSSLRSAFVVSLRCDACKGDGAMYRLNLDVGSEGRVLSRGTQVRLPAPPPVPPARGVSPVTVIIVMLLLLVALALLVLLVHLVSKRRARKNLPPPPPPRAGRKVVFTVVHGKNSGVTHRFEMVTSLLVGRDESCAFRILDDDQISARHCELFLDGGRVMVKDLRSSNGTFLNGVAIGSPNQVGEGDLLKLGQTELRVSC